MIQANVYLRKFSGCHYFCDSLQTVSHLCNSCILIGSTFTTKYLFLPLKVSSAALRMRLGRGCFMFVWLSHCGEWIFFFIAVSQFMVTYWNKYGNNNSCLLLILTTMDGDLKVWYLSHKRCRVAHDIIFFTLSNVRRFYLDTDLKQILIVLNLIWKCKYLYKIFAKMINNIQSNELNVWNIHVTVFYFFFYQCLFVNNIKAWTTVWTQSTCILGLLFGQII